MMFVHSNLEGIWGQPAGEALEKTLTYSWMLTFCSAVASTVLNVENIM